MSAVREETGGGWGRATGYQGAVSCPLSGKRLEEAGAGQLDVRELSAVRCQLSGRKLEEAWIRQLAVKELSALSCKLSLSLTWPSGPGQS